MNTTIYGKLIDFLREELCLSPHSIAIAQKCSEEEHAPLPMVLWQYGLVTLEELDGIYDWLENKGFYDLNSPV
ncbi:MAG: DUF2949 domain-containing protein [Cyanobacteria bacterium J083]|nr:MAG: DUF2949 domain-containing protein [Cyanobacteria bacterium J083]